MIKFRLFRSPYWRIVVPMGIIFAVVSQLYATVCGLGFTFDSHIYLEAAMYLKKSDLLWNFDHAIFQIKPPLFPVFLSVLSMELMRLINTLMLSVTLLIIARLFDFLLKDNRIKTIGFLSVAVFAPFIMVHVYLWTEPLFLLTFFSSILAYVNLKKTNNYLMIIWLVLLSLIMSLTRHVGIFIIVGYFLALIFNTNIGKKKATLYFVTSSVGFVLWNLLIKFNGFSDRMITFSSPLFNNSFARLDNIGIFLRGTSLWILPNTIPDWLRISLFLFAVLFLVMEMIKILKTSSGQALKGIMIIAVTYYILMHLPFKLHEFSEERYLVPIYPLFILISLYTIESLKEKFSNKFNVILLVLSLWLIYPTIRTIKNTVFWGNKICNEKIKSEKFDFSLPAVMAKDGINSH